MLVEVDFLLNPKDVTTAKALAQRFKLDKDRHGEMGGLALRQLMSDME